MPLLSKEFLALWDDPGEHVQIVFRRLDTQCEISVVVDVPDSPRLEIELDSLKVGEA